MRYDSRPDPPEGAGELDYLRRRERELLGLQETALDLNRLHSTGEVLGAIVRRARRLIGSDVCYLTAYDPARQDFYVRAFDGTVSDSFDQVRISRDLGSCRPIIESRSAFITPDYREDPRFMHDPRVDATLQGEGIVSLAGVPLLLEDRVLGILYVAQRRPRTYTPQDMALLLSLASHAAIAMENARLLDETRAAVRQLEAQTFDVQAAIAVHEQLISLVARDASLDELATMMAEVLQCGVAVLDEEGHAVCLANSPPPSSPLGFEDLAKGPGLRALPEALRQSRMDSRSVAVPLDAGTACRAVAIVSATQLLGGLVAWRRDAFSDSEIRTFERGAIASGIVLLSRDRVARAAERDTTELFDSLRQGHREAAALLARQAERAGLSLRAPLALLVAHLGERRLGYAVQAVKSATLGARVIVAEVEDRLAVLCAADRAAAVAETVQAALGERMGARPNILISQGFAAAAGFASAYRAALRGLRLLQALGVEAVIAPEASLAVYATLFSEAGAEQIDGFLQTTIGPLLAHDRSRNANFAETLLRYLDSGYNVRAAAVAMGLHDNTLRQRLGMIDSIVGDWRSSNRGFELHAALRLNALRNSLLRARKAPIVL